MEQGLLAGQPPARGVPVASGPASGGGGVGLAALGIRDAVHQHAAGLQAAQQGADPLLERAADRVVVKRHALTGDQVADDAVGADRAGSGADGFQRIALELATLVDAVQA